MEYADTEELKRVEEALANEDIPRCGNCLFQKPVSRDKLLVRCCFGGRCAIQRKMDAGCNYFKLNLKIWRKRNAEVCKELYRESERTLHRVPDDQRQRCKKGQGVSVVKNYTHVWTEADDNKLKELSRLNVTILYMTQAIDPRMGADQVTSRMKELGIQRAKNPKNTVIKDSEEVVIETKIRFCNGRFCKEKEKCQHYLAFVKFGKRYTTFMVSSTEDCITHDFKEWIPAEGYTLEDRTYFAETLNNQ